MLSEQFSPIFGQSFQNGTNGHSSDVFSVDAISGLEDIMQRLKRSATVGEVEDVAIGRQLLMMGIPAFVIVLAILAAFPAAMFANFAMMFVCGGGVACENPLETLLLFIFYFIAGPPLALLTFLGYVAG